MGMSPKNMMLTQNISYEVSPKKFNVLTYPSTHIKKSYVALDYEKIMTQKQKNLSIDDNSKRP